MITDRWTLAREAGALPPLSGRLLALDARGAADPGTLVPGGSVLAVQGFRPDHDRLAARGLEVVPSLPEGAGGFDVALVQVTKARAATLARLAEALAALGPGGVLLVDGAKEEGVESILKALRGAVGLDGVFAKAHGKLGWVARPPELPAAVLDWIVPMGETAEGYATVPGGFSPGGPDRGSELLVALVPPLKGRVADLGAGWGYIAAEVLAEQETITALDLVEADFAMLDAARHNVDDPRAAFHWADATAFAPETRYDAILSNPPFHAGRRADPELGRAFIAAAARLLAPSGRFFMVANRHLPYEAALKAAFGTGRMLGDLDGYKLYEAAKPRR